MRHRKVALLLSLATLGAAACKKESDSLVVVALTATDPGAVTASSVSIMVAGVEQTFTLYAGLSSVPIQVGVYVPSSVVGSVPVTATAPEYGYYACLSGATTTDISGAGVTVYVGLSLTQAPSCASGTGGTTGTGGSGTGGSGTGGSGGGPTLTSCQEYEHNDPSDPPCVDGINGQYVSDTRIHSVAFSPDGTLFATAGDDGRVKIWSFDGAGLSETSHVIPTSGVSFAAFTPDGSLIVAGSQSGLVTYGVPGWSLYEGLSGTTGNIVGLAVSADSQYVISISDANYLYVHALSNPAAPFKTMLAASPLGLVLSPSSTATDLTIAVSFATGRAEILDVNVTSGALTPEDAFTVEQDGAAAGVLQYSPDGTMLAIGDADGHIQFWSIPLVGFTPTGTALSFTKNGVASNVGGLAWTPDSLYLAAATGTLGYGGAASTWRVASRTQIANVVPTEFPLSVTFSPSGAALGIGEVSCGKVMVCTN
jgi:WD40 repeat protein